MPHLELTPQAEDDIADIDRHLSRLSQQAADRVLDGIDAACDRMAHSPGLGRPRSDLTPGLRSRATSDGYVIYFLPIDDGIEIQRVLHGSRNVDPAMFDT